MPSGKVLVSGGSGSSGSPLSSAEVYDPVTGGWSTTGALASARSGHTATLLPSGKVLVSGNTGSTDRRASAEVYDPGTGAWSITGAPATTRVGHTATLLPSGKVLVSGGEEPREALASAEVYDPGTGTWSTSGDLAEARSGHTATLLPSGEVLVSGGGYTGDALASAELYEDTGARQEWRPVIHPPAGQQPGQVFRITGSRLRGLSEASSGNAQSSATDFPLVSLLALEGGALTRVTLLDAFSDSEVIVRMPSVPDGHYLLSVMTNAIHGGQLVLVDGPPLAAPEITAPEALVNTRSPAIGGTAKPDSTVVVWLDGAMAGTTRADAQGEWSFTPDTELAEGLHRVVAIATDAVGDVSPDSEERSFTVDTVPPEPPVVTEPGARVNTEKPVITGTAEADCTVMVRLDETVAGTTRANAQGTWSFTPNTALAEGLHEVTATATDAVGNASPPSESRGFTFFIQRSHYGWSCATAPASPATWALLALVFSLGRRRLRPLPRPDAPAPARHGRGPHVLPRSARPGRPPRH